MDIQIFFVHTAIRFSAIRFLMLSMLPVTLVLTSVHVFEIHMKIKEEKAIRL
jgi:hypothetical protein